MNRFKRVQYQMLPFPFPERPRWWRRILVTVDDWMWDYYYAHPTQRRSVAHCWKRAKR